MTRSMEDRLNAEPAPGWKPEKGDMVIGEIISISTAPGTNWGPYPLIEIETDDGTAIAIHAFHTVIRTEIQRLQPAEGDRIGVKFLGTQKTKDGTEYEGYNVVLERRTPLAAPTPGASPTPAPAAASPVPASTPATPDWAGEEPF